MLLFLGLDIVEKKRKSEADPYCLRFLILHLGFVYAMVHATSGSRIKLIDPKYLYLTNRGIDSETNYKQAYMEPSWFLHTVFNIMLNVGLWRRH
jgi:hypothetical protein